MVLHPQKIVMWKFLKMVLPLRLIRVTKRIDSPDSKKFGTTRTAIPSIQKYFVFWDGTSKR